LATPPAKAGGSYTFHRHFEAYLKAQGLPCSTEMDGGDYDILFVNSWTIPYQTILRQKQKRPHLRVVQRVDGAAQDYGRHDGVDWLQRDVNWLADLTIYQSQYSYQATHERYGLIQQPGPIIHNPVNHQHFTQEGPIMLDWGEHPQRVISVGWSQNPLKGNWRIPQLAQAHSEVEFVVVGRATDVPSLPNIRKVAFLEHDQLPNALRSASAYLSLIERDACPNVIIEAMACGLPILYLPSGGVPELVRDAGLPFESHAEFYPQLTHLLAQRDLYSQRARTWALQAHDSALIFGQYVQAIQASTRRPLPSIRQTLHAWADYRSFKARDEARKWGRILTGQQPLRRPR
jgi:glycosyltransferase involved in cell wall biosynthesis